MSRSASTLCLLALLALAAFAVADSVIELDSESFDDVIVKREGAKLVEFYAPWCGHCKNLAPEYAKAANAFSTQKNVILAAVDADKHRSLGTKFGVSGFPTLKFFPEGSTEPEDYNGARTAEAIVEFLNSKTGAKGSIREAPSDVVTLTPDNFDKVVKDTSKDVFVEFYAPWCGHCKSLAPIWEKLGTDFKNDEHVVVAKLDADQHRSIAQQFDVSGFPTIKFFPKDNKKGEDYREGRTEEDLIKFLNTKTGAKRMPGGGLLPDAGLIDALSELAKSFSDEGKRDEILSQAKALVEEKHADDKYASYYVKVMEKIATQGNDYAAGEIARLARVVDGGSVKADRLDSFHIRKNILEQF